MTFEESKSEFERRRFLSLLTLVSSGTVRQAFAEQSARMWRIGWLSIASGPDPAQAAFWDELRRRGYTEGRNLTVHYRWSAGKTETLPALAADLVSVKVDLIIAISTRPVEAAMQATQLIPILTIASDAVESGFAKSLAHPSGNLTGVSLMTPELMDKMLQILRDLIPGFQRVAVLATTPGTSATRVALEHARRTTARHHIALTVAEAATGGDLAAAFASMKEAGAQAVIVKLTPISIDNRSQIVALAKQHQLPAIYESRLFVDAGGLASYGWNARSLYERLAYYVERVLQGVNPRDLPIEQATKIDLVVNATVARSLGIAIPQSVLVQANEIVR